jgi:HEAT repeat protein
VSAGPAHSPAKTCSRPRGALIAAALCTTAALVTVWLVGCNGPLQNVQNGPTGLFVGNLSAEARQTILDGLTDEDPLVRVDAIEAVVAAKQIRLMPKVQRLITDQSEWVRSAAALAVGDTQYALAQRQVAGLINDPNPNVKIAGAYAMYKLGSVDSLEIFRNALASNNQTVRANAALLLGKSGSRDALRPLWWVLGSEDASYPVKLKAAEAIAKLGDDRILPKLWAAAHSAFVDDKIMAIRALGTLGTEKTREVLVTKLDDDALLVRLAAAEQLGKLGDNTGQQVVVDLFRKNLFQGLDPQSRHHVEVFAAQAIGQIKTPQVTRFLPRLLKNPSKTTRLAAAKAVFLAQMSGGTR